MGFLGRARGRVGLLAAVILAACLVAGSAGAGASAPKAGVTARHEPSGLFAGGRPGFSLTGAEVRASALRTPHANRSQLPVKAGARLPWLSRANSDTFQAGSGRLVTKIYPSAVNYKTTSGAFAPIDTGLVRSGSGLRQQANDLGVVLPASASDPAKVSTAAGALSFGLTGASGTGSVAGTVERFAGALPGVDLGYRSQGDGIGWEARVSSVAASQGLSWLVSASSGLTAKVVSGGVAFRNGAGKTVWLFTAPVAHLTGSTKPEPTRLSVSRTAKGTVIHVVALPAGARTGGHRRFADVDPNATGATLIPAALVNPNQTVWSGEVIPGTFAFSGPAHQTGDCYVDSGSPDTSFCLGDTNYVGPNDNTLINFDVTDDLPRHVQILQAYAVMGLSSQSTGTAESVGVWQPAKQWSNLATWNSYDGSNNWDTPGGDTTGSMESSQTLGTSGDVGGDAYWDIEPSVQDWVDGNPQQVDGLIFKATDGSSAPNTLGFNTETSPTDAPYLTIYYQQRMGDYPNAKYDSQQLTDRSNEGVNVATGNLVVSNTDLNLTGVNGLNLNVGRYYNNLSGDQTGFGIGWSMGTGADTYLAMPADQKGVVDYFDGTGNAQMYIMDDSGTEISPKGVDAKLTMDSPSNVWGSSTFTLLFRHSGITETFAKAADSLNTIARLQTLSDRNGNTLHYHYNSSDQLTSIVDSHGSTTTIDWSPEGYIDEITDPTGRQYKYFQNSGGQLTQYQDPAGHDTNYSYDADGNLTQVQTPAGNITKIAYDAGNTNQVTSVTRLINPSDSSGPETTYQTATASGTCPADPGATQDTVSDPDRHTTTYCTDDLSRLTKAVDGNGHARSTSYSADGFIQTETSALNNTPTSFSYTTDGKDNVQAIQQGQTGGETGASGYSAARTTTLNYGGATGTGDNQYEPTSTQDAQGNTTTYQYGSGTSGDYGAGEPKSITDGLTSHNQATLTYNSDGTIATSTDPQGNETTYAYTSGNLTSVTPPSGSGQNAIALTYDSANRVKTVSTISGSPASGHNVTYCYDDFDRITQATYQNADGSTAATLHYDYDADGNLYQLDDPSGSTYYQHDGLNRPTGEELPNGTETDYGYDPASNLTSLYDGSGTLTYTYDKANQLTSVKDPGSSKPSASYTYDADGNRAATTYASGAAIANTYNDLDQLKKVNDTYKTSSGSTAHLTYSYAYTSGGLQQSVTDQANNQTSYTYDALNRLTEAKTQTSGGTGSTTADYQYNLDGNGNLTSEAISGSAVTAGTTSYAYNSGNEICWSLAGTSSNGCGTTPSGGHTYSYNTDGNQTNNGNGLTATYNALGQTTSMTSGGTTTGYSYLGEGQSQLIADGSNTLTNSSLGLVASGSTYYTRDGGGEPVDERTPSATYNYLYDGNGNVVALTDSTGHLVNQYAYDPYGTKTTSTGSAPNPFAFKAGYQTTSGLIHFGARYLNPTDARWTQQDPLNQITDLTQGDRYAFAGDDPVNLADLTGMSLNQPPDNTYGSNEYCSQGQQIGNSARQRTCAGYERGYYPDNGDYDGWQTGSSDTPPPGGGRGDG